MSTGYTLLHLFYSLSENGKWKKVHEVTEKSSVRLFTFSKDGNFLSPGLRFQTTASEKAKLSEQILLYGTPARLSKMEPTLIMKKKTLEYSGSTIPVFSTSVFMRNAEKQQTSTPP